MKALFGTIAALILLMGFSASPAVAGVGAPFLISIDDLTEVLRATSNANLSGTNVTATAPEFSGLGPVTVVVSSTIPGVFPVANAGFNILDQNGVTLSDLLRLQIGTNLIPGQPTPPGDTDVVLSFTSDVDGGPPLMPFTASPGETITNLPETGAFQVVYDHVGSFGQPLTIQFRSDVEVPEPASLTLFGTALLGFGVLRRRRRKRGMHNLPLLAGPPSG